MESKAREGELEEFIRHDRRRNSPNRRNLRNQPEAHGQEIPHQQGDDYVNMIVGEDTETEKMAGKRKHCVEAIYQVKQVLDHEECKDPITFTDEDFGRLTSLSLDPLVVTMIVANKHVRRIMVDTGSFTDILFYDAFVRMGLSESQINLRKSSLSGF